MLPRRVSEVPATERMTAARLPGLVALFEAAGSPCHCRFFHFAGDTNAWLERCFHAPEQNREELASAALAGSPEADGVVALDGERVIGWAKLAPTTIMRKRYDGRFYRGLPHLAGDRPGGATLGCFLVHPEHRRRGVARALAAGAVTVARAAGYRFVDAFPRCRDEELGPDEMWTGPMAALLAAGFQVVSPHEQYPVLELRL